METIDERMDRLIQTKKIKVDSKTNGTINLHKIEKAKNRDKKRVPLRIDSKTIILVKPENKTPEYKEKYKATLEECRWQETRMNINKNA